MDDRAGRDGLADFAHRVAEEFAVFGAANGVERGAEQADVKLVEDACVVQFDREVEADLAAERGQQAVGALALDDAAQHVDAERLDVDGVGDAFVGHDRGGVGVDEDRADAFLAHRLAGLGAGVIELGGLTDHDRPAADDQYRLRFFGGTHGSALTGATRSGIRG